MTRVGWRAIVVAAMCVCAGGTAYAADPVPGTKATPQAAAQPAPAPPGAHSARPAAAGVDATKIDCKNVQPAFRSRCTEMQRVQKLCATAPGDTRKTCIQKNVHYARLKADCSAPHSQQAKDRCLERNRMLDAAVACEGKSGDALKACAAAHPVAHELK
ncbi:MAG: hypothetical protein JSR18_04970 [Proteobacteria bacterium]|nr:hypothetical protein [Pseudomonadota bacterium]